MAIPSWFGGAVSEGGGLRRAFRRAGDLFPAQAFPARPGEKS